MIKNSESIFGVAKTNEYMELFLSSLMAILYAIPLLFYQVNHELSITSMHNLYRVTYRRDCLCAMCFMSPKTVY